MLSTRDLGIHMHGRISLVDLIRFRELRLDVMMIWRP